MKNLLAFVLFSDLNYFQNTYINRRKIMKTLVSIIQLQLTFFSYIHTHTHTHINNFIKS